MTLQLPALWRWWITELTPLVPAAPRAAMQRRRLRPILAFGDDSVVLWDPRVKDGQLAFVDAARIPLVGDAAAIAHAGRAAIESLPVRGGSATRKVILTLPRSQILRKQIALPAAVEENLHQTLAYDLDRHTPFRPEQLYFDAAVVSRDMARKEIRVDWAAALKPIVDQAWRQAESWGAKVVGVAPETISPASMAMTNAGVWSKLNLLPHDDRPATAWWRRWQLWVPIAVIVVAVLVSVALPLWQKREFAVQFGEVTDEARKQATAADALRQQLDQATGDYNFALSKKYAYPSALQLLDDVTRLLPDDTWLTQLEIKNVPKGKEPAHREMLLRGESANAGKLISALEESKLFEQAAPRSPTTKIQPGPGEVFDLGTTVIASQPPQLVAVAGAEAKNAAAEKTPASGTGAKGAPTPDGKGVSPPADEGSPSTRERAAASREGKTSPAREDRPAPSAPDRRVLSAPGSPSGDDSDDGAVGWTPDDSPSPAPPVFSSAPPRPAPKGGSTPPVPQAAPAKASPGSGGARKP